MKQTNKALTCTHSKCKELQTEDGEFCAKHYPKKKKTRKVKIMFCPMCEEGYLVYCYAGVHYWVCDGCPFIGFEFYTKKDITNLAKAIK